MCEPGEPIREKDKHRRSNRCLRANSDAERRPLATHATGARTVAITGTPITGLTPGYFRSGFDRQRRIVPGAVSIMCSSRSVSR